MDSQVTTKAIKDAYQLNLRRKSDITYKMSYIIDILTFIWYSKSEVKNE